MPKPPRRLVLGWLALVLLLAGNITVAHFASGGINPPLLLAIAIAMASIVLVVFMELGERAWLYWIFAGAGFFWLGILISLIAADYVTRVGFTPT